MKTKFFIDVSQKNDIAILKLNRPEKRNAINDEMRNAIIDMLLELNNEDTVKAVVITGAGTVFCAWRRHWRYAGTLEGTTRQGWL